MIDPAAVLSILAESHTEVLGLRSRVGELEAECEQLRHAVQDLTADSAAPHTEPARKK